MKLNRLRDRRTLKNDLSGRLSPHIIIYLVNDKISIPDPKGYLDSYDCYRSGQRRHKIIRIKRNRN